MFSEIPFSVRSDILSSWLHIRDIARLDSACCRKSTREGFLNLCRRKEFSFLTNVSTANQSLIMWLTIRRFHVVSFEIITDKNVALLAKVLSTTGEQLQSVTIRSQKTDISMAVILSMLALYCSNLSKLHFYECVVDIVLLEILVANSFLKDIKAESCSFTEIFSKRNVEGFCLPSVTGIVVTAPLRRGDIFKLVKLCPALLTLQLSCATLTDYYIVQIVESCPHVRTCILYGCSSLTEYSLCKTVLRWQLETFAVRGCGECTDELLRCICDNCSTLECFLFMSSNTFSACAIVEVLRKCLQLTSVALGWYSLKPREFIEIVAPTLSNILVLTLSQQLSCDSVFHSVGETCSRLEMLDLVDDKLGQFTKSGTGLMHVLQQCVNLRTLIVNGSVMDSYFNSVLVLNLLCSVRPNIQLTCCANSGPTVAKWMNVKFAFVLGSWWCRNLA